jgi:hypothetical protein
MLVDLELKLLQHCGGDIPTLQFMINAESWDGTTWTEVSELNTAR